jgi:hypothetical protein
LFLKDFPGPSFSWPERNKTRLKRNQVGTHEEEVALGSQYGISDQIVNLQDGCCLD